MTQFTEETAEALSIIRWEYFRSIIADREIFKEYECEIARDVSYLQVAWKNGRAVGAI